VVFKDMDGTLSGGTAGTTVVAANRQAVNASTSGSCSGVSAWNAQVCEPATSTALMVFESLDADRLTRRLHPVIITEAEDEVHLTLALTLTLP